MLDDQARFRILLGMNEDDDVVHVLTPGLGKCPFCRMQVASGKHEVGCRFHEALLDDIAEARKDASGRKILLHARATLLAGQVLGQTVDEAMDDYDGPINYAWIAPTWGPIKDDLC